MTRSEIIKLKKQNTRLYPIYKSISVDLIFYYTINLIFLTQTKGLTVSEVILGNAAYSIFNVIFQIPILLVTEKLGKKKSLIIGNILNSISIIVLLFSNSLSILVIAQLFSALAFSIKNISESSILNDSIPLSKKKGNLVAKIDGSGQSSYYYINAVSSLLAGYLFGVNGYIPIIICLVITIISIVMSLRFKDINKLKNIDKELKSEVVTKPKTLKQYLKELKSAFKFILRSKRLKGIILFSSVFSAVAYLMNSYEISLLQEMNITTRDIGVTFAVLGVISGIAASRQNQVHEKLKNKTLTFIGISFVLACTVAGFISSVSYSLIAIGLILITYALRHADIGLFNVSIKRYLGNFATEKISSKIYSVNYMIQSLCRAVLSILGSMLLEFTKSTNYALLILGCVSTLAMFAITNYMKSRVGLKSSEYKREDIEYNYKENIE